MIYFKSTLIGFVTVLAGCVVTPFFVLMRVRLVMMKKSPGIGAVAGGVNPIELMHTVGFWVFVLVLFSAGFSLSVFTMRR